MVWDNHTVRPGKEALWCGIVCERLNIKNNVREKSLVYSRRKKIVKSVKANEAERQSLET